eukprot:Skav214990  [mRNA]  locus=scaffold508:404188:404892:- [translate_table: standard]
MLLKSNPRFASEMVPCASSASCYLKATARQIFHGQLPMPPGSHALFSRKKRAHGADGRKTVPSTSATYPFASWRSFLRQMHRAFVVNGEPSEVIFSDHGMPEGDSMSCLGMILRNFSYHHCMFHFQPRLTEMSYVDDLELLGNLPQDLVSGFVTLQAWADSCGLNLDLDKSSCWAVKAADRSQLALLGLPVTLSGADSGASMIYCAQHRNQALQLRIKSVQPFWGKLRALKLPI